MKKRLIQALILAFIYVSLGTWELLGNIDLSKKIDVLSDGLDLYLVYPSHIIGSLMWWMMGGAKPETVYLAWIGQLLNFLLFIVVFFIVLSLISKIKTIKK